MILPLASPSSTPDGSFVEAAMGCMLWRDRTGLKEGTFGPGDPLAAMCDTIMTNMPRLAEDAVRMKTQIAQDEAKAEAVAVREEKKEEGGRDREEAKEAEVSPRTTRRSGTSPETTRRSVRSRSTSRRAATVAQHEQKRSPKVASRDHSTIRDGRRGDRA